MATGGDGPADDCSGINFGVELDIPWNAPDVIGLCARWPGAPVVNVLLGRVEDISADVLSPVGVSDRDPDAIVYDCRPPILPVSIMRGPRAPCIVGSPVLVVESGCSSGGGGVGGRGVGGGTGCSAGARIGILR